MTEQTVTLQNANAHHAVVLVCEHASAHIPARYNNLGLTAEVARSHIAWDPGAVATARFLSKSLDALLIESTVSRLVYDCNRPPESADAMPERSEVYDIPGNRNLSEQERQLRIDSVYRPFESQIAQSLGNHSSTPILVTIHSFTPVYNGHKREVDIGILHDDDSRLADAMLQAVPDVLSGYTIKRNEPYGPDDGVTHTLKRHAVASNLFNVMIEIRNDLLASDAQCREAAAGIEQWLGSVLPEA